MINENKTPIEKEERGKTEITADVLDAKIVKADLIQVMWEDRDLNEMTFTVLTALQNMSRVRYYGVSMLVDILKGCQTKRITENNLYNLSEFGALRDIDWNKIQEMIEWLIKEHMVLKTKGNYPVLHLTYEGLHYSEKMTIKKLNELKNYMERN